MQTIASEKLSAALRPRVMSQSELAEKLGVSPQAVSKWVRGAGKPSLELMARIEELMGIPIKAWTQPTEGETPDDGEAA